MIKEIKLKSCIEFAVATEDIGAKFYTRMASRFAGNQEVSNLFELLGKDEEVHKHNCVTLLNSYLSDLEEYLLGD